jgi:hypothetical protein
MPENDKRNGNDQYLDDAWAKFQDKLKSEPVNTRWSQWDGEAVKQETAWLEPEMTPVPTLPTAGLAGPQDTHPIATPSLMSRLKRSKRAKWIGGAAAAVMAVTVMLTPAGNQALAAILGQFRMEQITTVQENDAEQLFNTFVADGKLHESVNKLGNFTRQSGTVQGDFKVTDLPTILKRKIVVPDNFKEEKAFVTPSESITLTINAAEVNKAMSRLGATKLLPDSIDGRKITFKLGESVHMNLESGRGTSASFVQMPVPEISVDSSVDVKEAMDAVIDFPLLPENLKTALQSSSILSGGSAPLPIIAREGTQMIKIDGRDVLLEQRQSSGQKTYYSSMWVKDGQLYELSGNTFGSEQELEAAVAELIRQ